MESVPVYLIYSALKDVAFSLNICNSSQDIFFFSISTSFDLWWLGISLFFFFKKRKKFNITFIRPTTWSVLNDD
jgi:sulfite exporter TauE/SafE